MLLYVGRITPSAEGYFIMPFGRKDKSCKRNFPTLSHLAFLDVLEDDGSEGIKRGQLLESKDKLPLKPFKIK